MRIFHVRIPTNCMNASQYTPYTRQMYYAKFILSHKFTRYITSFPQLPQELTYNNSVTVHSVHSNVAKINFKINRKYTCNTTPNTV